MWLSQNKSVVFLSGLRSGFRILLRFVGLRILGKISWIFTCAPRWAVTVRLPQ